MNLELTGEEFRQIKMDAEVHSKRLREVPFTSLAQYLALLEKCALEINSNNGTKIILLAAAVSDFDVCESANQKIDSSSSFSEIKLKKVEKVISKLTSSWAPQAATFSFKLETNEKRKMWQTSLNQLHKTVKEAIEAQKKARCISSNLEGNK